MAVLIAGGDRAARNRMVQAYLGLVVVIRLRGSAPCGRGLALDDLVGEGNLGLIRAAERFDPDFGTRFSTYASYWIREAIQDALTNRTATIRLPAHMVKLLARWRRAERTLAREGDHTPDFEEVAGSLGLSERQKSLVSSHAYASRSSRGAGLQTSCSTRCRTGTDRSKSCFKRMTSETACCAAWRFWTTANVSCWLYAMACTARSLPTERLALGWACAENGSANSSWARLPNSAARFELQWQFWAMPP